MLAVAVAEINHLALAVLVALVAVGRAAQGRLELLAQQILEAVVAVVELLEAVQGLLAAQAAQA